LRQIISGSTGLIFTIFSPNERYLREFSRPGRTSFLVPLGMLPWQPILGKICKVTFIQHAGISQWIRISQFQVINGTIFFYILCNFGDNRFTNYKDLTRSFCTFWETAKATYHTKYLSKYWTELHQLFSVGRLMYTYYKTEITFAVVEERLLW